jgi:hypothetical protein
VDVIELRLRVFADRIRDADVPAGDFDGDVYVGCLHGVTFSFCCYENATRSLACKHHALQPAGGNLRREKSH